MQQWCCPVLGKVKKKKKIDVFGILPFLIFYFIFYNLKYPLYIRVIYLHFIIFYIVKMEYREVLTSLMMINYFLDKDDTIYPICFFNLI